MMMWSIKVILAIVLGSIMALLLCGFNLDCTKESKDEVMSDLLALLQAEFESKGIGIKLDSYGEDLRQHKKITWVSMRLLQAMK